MSEREEQINKLTDTIQQLEAQLKEAKEDIELNIQQSDENNKVILQKEEDNKLLK